jgi:hypothetical protein
MVARDHTAIGFRVAGGPEDAVLEINEHRLPIDHRESAIRIKAFRVGTEDVILCDGHSRFAARANKRESRNRKSFG